MMYVVWGREGPGGKDYFQPLEAYSGYENIHYDA